MIQNCQRYIFSLRSDPALDNHNLSPSPRDNNGILHPEARSEYLDNNIASSLDNIPTYNNAPTFDELPAADDLGK